jgi:beta-glucuronidase
LTDFFLNGYPLITSRTTNTLIVAVNNTLTPSTLPPGVVQYYDDDMHPPGYVQQVTYFDFCEFLLPVSVTVPPLPLFLVLFHFLLYCSSIRIPHLLSLVNYAGIDRKVYLYTTPSEIWVDDITVLPQHNIVGEMELAVNLSLLSSSSFPFSYSVLSTLYDANNTIVGTLDVDSGIISIDPSDVHLWDVGTPYLYTLEIIATSTSTNVSDAYRLTTVGLRTVQVTGTQFLLNDLPFYFHGVDRHEGDLFLLLASSTSPSPSPPPFLPLNCGVTLHRLIFSETQTVTFVEKGGTIRLL